MGVLTGILIAFMALTFILEFGSINYQVRWLSQRQSEASVPIKVSARYQETALLFRRVSEEEKILMQVCRTLWIEMRRNRCPDADDSAVLWSFLPGTTGKISDVVNSCTPSPTLDCNYPEQYACYLLKKLYSGKTGSITINGTTYDFYYDKTGIRQTTDPCAFTGLVKAVPK